MHDTTDSERDRAAEAATARRRSTKRRRPVQRSLGDLLDAVPYIAFLGVPVAALMLDAAIPGRPDPGDAYRRWWIVGRFALWFYVPSILACGLVEWQARRQGWARTCVIVRVVRWAHFLAAFGPIIGLVVFLAMSGALVPF
ncbi:hypothetical protein D3218_08740 [Aureimonas flava]|uniref:Uncharacterized protein n=1 Tax=Aureimonas flava TaxID=2320271 RepID=A0A3A1WU22_9HYPH|nr:hypothetical protein [Aureimonas flava]RIY01431.1 hypothetical protein D3218_08740 [Aureimonas flava]